MADSIKIGNLDISAFKVGSSDCKIYLGTTLIYSGGTTPPTPPIYQGFCKLTLSDDTVVEIQGSGELTSAMTSSYTSSLVSAEIGTLCTSIGEGTFIQCSSLTSCTIGSGVTSIGRYAFNGCSSLTSIVIPDSVTSIGHWTFYQCSSLTSCTIGSGVTSIGSSAFRNCSGLTSVNIPSGVTDIGGMAFYNCTSLSSVTSNAMTAPTIQSQTFRDVKTGGTLTVPSGSSGYDVWMGTDDYYLGKYNWTKVEQ